MIIIIDHKTFKKLLKDKKALKKICANHANDPIIFDGTDGDSDVLSSMSHVIALKDFSAAGKLTLKKEDRAAEFSKAEMKRAKKKFFGSNDFIYGTLSLVESFVELKGDVNLLVVITEKSYKALAKDYVKQMNKIIGIKAKSSKDGDFGDMPDDFGTINEEHEDKLSAECICTWKQCKKDSTMLSRKPKKKELKAMKKGLKKAKKKAVGDKLDKIK